MPRRSTTSSASGRSSSSRTSGRGLVIAVVPAGRRRSTGCARGVPGDGQRRRWGTTSARRCWNGGVFAGWLIALMGWLLPFAESGRVWVIILLTYIVGAGAISRYHRRRGRDLHARRERAGVLVEGLRRLRRTGPDREHPRRGRTRRGESTTPRSSGRTRRRPLSREYRAVAERPPVRGRTRRNRDARHPAGAGSFSRALATPIRMPTHTHIYSGKVMGNLVRLVGPNGAVEILGVKLVGVNAPRTARSSSSRWASSSWSSCSAAGSRPLHGPSSAGGATSTSSSGPGRGSGSPRRSSCSSGWSRSGSTTRPAWPRAWGW